MSVLKSLFAAARTFSAALYLLILPSAAAAYIGPGAGLGAFAIFLTLGAGLLLLVFGLVWYPVKRVMKRKRAGRDANGPTEGE